MDKQTHMPHTLHQTSTQAPSNKILMLVAHPDLDSSRANLALLKTAEKVADVDVNDLYELYPNMFIDGAQERERLSAYETIILQYPIYWYATPGLLKEWFDRTLKHGWAYGEGGNALKGKNLLCSITHGSQPESYTPCGHHGMTTYEMMKPIRHLAQFCQMNWLEPFILPEARRLDDDAFEQKCAEFETLLKKLIKSTHQPNIANSN